MKQPTNAVLLEKIENIIEHLIRLNDSVAKNSKFRIQTKMGLTVVGSLIGGTSLIIGVIYTITKLV